MDELLFGNLCSKPFAESLVEANFLTERGFDSWLFRPGMEFGEGVTWWGGKAARKRPHEGIDFHSYLDTAGDCHCLLPGDKIPLYFDGRLVDIFPDFLGQSLLFAHDQEQNGWRFYSIISHVKVELGIALGRRCSSGTIVARLAKSPRPSVPAHLHISTLVIFGPPPHPISWPMIVTSDILRVVDPSPYVRGCRQAGAGLSL